MLGFFRRSQKIFLAIVACVIVISFLFFGTGGGIQAEKETDRIIGELVDGSVLLQSRLDGLIALLERGLEEGTKMPNLLNSSLVHRRFILSGLGMMLAERLFDDLEEELRQRWKRACQYIPYEHPYAPHINARQIWTQYSPKTVAAIDAIQSRQGEFAKDDLVLLFDCYRAQAAFPSHLLHQMLYFQERENKGVSPDPGLPRANVALFGFEAIRDWFGPQFVEEIALFVLNAACLAKQRGYAVGPQEARCDLYGNVMGALERLQSDTPLEGEKIQEVYTAQIRQTGLTEGEVVSLWQEVLAFERMFEEAGQGVFVDSLSLDQFKGFAVNGTTVVRYQMPTPLRFSNFDQVLKFQRYQEIVSEGELLDLPQPLRDTQEIMDQHPDLVYKRFHAEVATVTKDEVAARVSLKETWDWEKDLKHYSLLALHFPVLKVGLEAPVEERMEMLDQLDPNTRFEIDHFARLQLVDAHPEWIEEELCTRESTAQILQVRLEEPDNPLSGPCFLALLESEGPELNAYTVDEQTYFRVVLLDKYPGWHLVPFEDADRVLEKKLDWLLRTAYENGDYVGPFEQVRDCVIRDLYADLIAAIGRDASDLDALAAHRFDAYLSRMRQLAMEDRDAFALALERPYALVGSTEKGVVDNQDLREGEYGPVEGGAFFQMIGRDPVLATKEEIAAAKRYLATEAQEHLMKTLIQAM